MLIHCCVSGYHDWAPVPADVEVTDDDKKALLVKKMQDDEWYMRITIVGDTHHDVNLPEEAVCRRMAALEFLGKRSSREEVVVETLRKSFELHFDAEHLDSISIHDSGPDVDLYEATLADIGVPEERREAAVKRYVDQVDLTQYLNVVFKTQNSRSQ